MVVFYKLKYYHSITGNRLKEKKKHKEHKKEKKTGKTGRSC